jgi:hypothetical protein
MPVHIEKLTSDVTIQDGGTSLSPAEIERLVTLVVARLEQRARDAERARAATALGRQASKPLEVGR